jgi:PPOX class probable F420-dependent enzyme
MDLLAEERFAVLATTRADGRPRLVPVTFAMSKDERGVVLYIALDDKPKRVSDVHDLGRVRDIQARPQVTLVVHRQSEDWHALAWTRVDGAARLLEPAADSDAAEHSLAVGLLRGRYPQYATHALEHLPVIRIAVDHVVEWQASP